MGKSSVREIKEQRRLFRRALVKAAEYRTDTGVDSQAVAEKLGLGWEAAGALEAWLTSNGYIEGLTAAHIQVKSRAIQETEDEDEADQTEAHESWEGNVVASSIKIFISHSSEDVEIVRGLIRFLEAALEIPQNAIRCTSVHGYKLQGGDDGSDVLRGDLESCDVVIGVFTAKSLQSEFVLMELGAGWALQKRRIPLIGPGARFSDLKGPYHSLHGIRLDSEADMATVPATVSTVTGFARTNNDGKITAELKELVALATTAPTVGSAAASAPSPATPPVAMSDADAKIVLAAWLRKQRRVEGKPFSEIDTDARVPEGAAKRLLDHWVEEPWMVAACGDAFVTLERGAERVRDVDDITQGQFTRPRRR